MRQFKPRKRQGLYLNSDDDTDAEKMPWPRFANGRNGLHLEISFPKHLKKSVKEGDLR